MPFKVSCVDIACCNVTELPLPSGSLYPVDKVSIEDALAVPLGKTSVVKGRNIGQQGQKFKKTGFRQHIQEKLSEERGRTWKQ